MKFHCLLTKVKLSSLLITLVSLTVSCGGAQTPSSTVTTSQSPNSASSDSPSNVTRQSIALNGGDESNIDKLLLQLNRADESNKELSLGLLEDGKKLAEIHRKEGLHGGRSGLSKLFCGSVLGYPTTEALIGCAESLALGDASFDVKVRRFKQAANIYRATLEFSERTENYISMTERQKIEENIKCLDAFVKSPNPNSPGCELIEISLKKP